MRGLPLGIRPKTRTDALLLRALKSAATGTVTVESLARAARVKQRTVTERLSRPEWEDFARHTGKVSYAVSEDVVRVWQQP